MSEMSPAPDLDDAGIFGLVVLATIATLAGLSVAGYPLWAAAPAFVGYAILGELGARKIAAIKGARLE